jgi:hypothetical protein
MPYQLCYASTATREMPRQALFDLLTEARRYNTKAGITGLLLYQNGQFLQVLEGEADPVRALFKRICNDKRHTRIALLFEELVSERQYPDWSMGFQALDGSEWMEFPNEDGSSKDLRTMAESMGRAKELLLYVRKRGLDPEKDLLEPANG